MARRLGLNRIPTICTTSAHLSPMIWWAGSKVRVVIPTKLFDQMDAQQSQWILAHELEHIRRRDYLVRWIEWFACVCFWWNPVVWWAQRNLRAAEEICCDDLVLSCLKPKAHAYAEALLTAVEFLARPALRLPAMASEINSGGFLERRFRMIIARNPSRLNSRGLQACILLCAIVVLPFGMVWAQDYEAIGHRLNNAVEKGEITRAQAGAIRGGRPVPGDMSGMDMSGAMPGMMSINDMQTLTKAEGADFDRLFLTMMIAHHRGAIEMAQDEQAQGRSAEAVGLARRIEAAQTEEIARMQQMLG